MVIHIRGPRTRGGRRLGCRLAKLEQVAGAGTGETGEQEGGSEDRTRLYRRLVSLEQRHTASLITISRLEAERSFSGELVLGLFLHLMGGEILAWHCLSVLGGAGLVSHSPVFIKKLTKYKDKIVMLELFHCQFTTWPTSVCSAPPPAGS